MGKSANKRLKKAVAAFNKKHPHSVTTDKKSGKIILRLKR